MQKDVCPICGELELIKKNGDFHFETPPNILKRHIIIEDAEWEECGNCNEIFLRSSLIEAIEKEIKG